MTMEVDLTSGYGYEDWYNFAGNYEQTRSQPQFHEAISKVSEVESLRGRASTTSPMPCLVTNQKAEGVFLNTQGKEKAIPVGSVRSGSGDTGIEGELSYSFGGEEDSKLEIFGRGWVNDGNGNYVEGTYQQDSEGRKSVSVSAGHDTEYERDRE